MPEPGSSAEHQVHAWSLGLRGGGGAWRGPSSPSTVMGLQRAIGNHAVTHLLHAQAIYRQQTPTPAPVNVQRCGPVACDCANDRPSGAAVQREQSIAPAAHPVISAGSSGAAVEDLQRRLNQAGATQPLAVDGLFGQGTQRAVISFQQSQGLAPDGIVGPKTWAAFDAVTPVDSPVPGAGETHQPGSVSGAGTLPGLEKASFGETPGVGSVGLDKGSAGTDLPGLAPAGFGGGGDACEQGPSFVNTGNSSGLIGSIYFCTDRFDLDLNNDVPELQKLKAYEPLLATRHVKFVFVGFADARGTDDHNATLSLNRAKSVEGFVRNLFVDHPHYDHEESGLGRSQSLPGLLEGFRRVDILAEPAVRPPVTPPPPVPGSLKTRKWSARIERSASATGAVGGLAALKLTIVDNEHSQKLLFEFLGAGPSVGTPSASLSPSAFVDFTTSLALEFHHFEGTATWRSAQIQPFFGASTDVLFLLGPVVNVGNEPVELHYEGLGLGLSFGIGVSVFLGKLARVDLTPSPA
jgi:outer membrane protein OmpA-like peptidoglycan-associated protein